MKEFDVDMATQTPLSSLQLSKYYEDEELESDLFSFLLLDPDYSKIILASTEKVNKELAIKTAGKWN